MRNIAIILAGGNGTRFGSTVPKQYLQINDRMIIEYTIDAFEHHPEIDEIAVVCHPNFAQTILDSIKKQGYQKVKKILNGGDSRFHSSLSAIRAYDDDNEKKILIHDGVRPLVSAKTISDCILALNTYNAIGTGIATTDTIWETTNGEITNIPDRSSIFRAQTPQGFKYKTIKEAYKKALLDEMVPVTDDCGVVNHYLCGEKIGIVKGSDTNIKITQQEDIIFFKTFLSNNASIS